MKNKLSKILMLALVLAILVANVFATTLPMAFAQNSLVVTDPTGYDSADDVVYKTGNAGGRTVTANWGARGEVATFLSEKANGYYTGNYTFSNLSTYQGGSLQGNAHSSALYAQLQSMMRSKSSRTTSYDETKSYYRYTDCLKNDTSMISSFYSGTVLGGSWGSSPRWNREHTWPNSKGLGGADENDIMMLRPTAEKENSSRGNTAYGLTSGYYDPGEATRGDCARIALYVYTRWGNTEYMWGKSGVIQNVDVLLSWMAEDPVDTWEMGRNDAVQSITGVRNVFVDYPELAWKLFSKQMPVGTSTPSGNGNGGGSGSENQLEYLQPSTYSMTLVEGQTHQLTVTAQPASASNSVTWSSTNANVATVSAEGVVTAKSQGSTTIVATSTVNTNIKAYVTVEVKGVKSVALSGAPTTTDYSAGQTFNPAGLTVTVTYSDNSTSNVNLSACSWVDGVTGQTTLSVGTTFVICQYGNFTQMVEGITVTGVQSQTVTVDRSSFSASGSYSFHSFASGEVKGQAFIYAGTTDKLQFNSSKDYYYLYGSAPAGITSVTVYLASDSKDWELLTNSTPYDNTSSKVPTEGTSHGTKTVTSSGVTWDLTGNANCYFTLNYKGTGVVYISKIEITYGAGGSVTPPVEHTVSLDKSSADMQTGDNLTLTATATGNVSWVSSNTKVVTVKDGVVTAVGKGSATITAICGNAKATCQITVTQKPCTAHVESSWITDTIATCQKQGERHTECTVCGEVIQRETTPTIAHTFGNWVTTTQPTQTTQGEQTRTCSVCKATETRKIDQLVDASNFEQLVDSIQSATTLTEQFEAIKQAVNAYNSYSVTEQQQLAVSYQKLQDAINQYNQRIANQNTNNSNALSVAVVSMAGVTLLSAVALAFIKKWF